MSEVTQTDNAIPKALAAMENTQAMKNPIATLTLSYRLLESPLWHRCFKCLILPIWVFWQMSKATASVSLSSRQYSSGRAWSTLSMEQYGLSREINQNRLSLDSQGPFLKACLGCDMK